MKKMIIVAASAVVVFSGLAFKSAGETKEVTIINTIEVKDFATFKKNFDAGAPIRDKAGIKVVAVFQSVDNANLVTVMEEAASAESAKAFFADPKAKEAMEKSGVISKPELKILNKVH
jgi:hypothetical protein